MTLENILVEGKKYEIREFIEYNQDKKALALCGNDIFYRLTEKKPYYDLKKHYQEDIK